MTEHASTPVSLPGDRSAIVLSGLCLLHCLLPSLAVGLLPWLAWFSGNESLVHRWMLVAIVPISLLALLRGCRRHREPLAVRVGVGALAVLVFAALAGDELLQPWLETLMTIGGSLVLATSHLLNLRALRCVRQTV